MQVDQDPSNKKSEDKAKHNKILTTYDRLLPRYGGNSGGAEKRKIEENTSSDSAIPATTSDVSKAKKLCNNTKKEYSRLKTLVPALTEREDLSKVEIIEETIRSVADRQVIATKLSYKWNYDSGRNYNLWNEVLFKLLKCMKIKI